MATKKWFPEKITAIHVRKAAKIWGKEKGFLNFTDSIYYDVVIDGEKYPPKAISSLAYKFATGSPIASNDFGGARDGIWHHRLKELGFVISNKRTSNRPTTLSPQAAWPFPNGEKISPEGKDAPDLESEHLDSKTIAEQAERSERLRRIDLIKNQIPQRSEVPVFRFNRSSDVVKERLYIARGICERCQKEAPFLRSRDGSPYLEVHHVKPLSKGGLDSVDNTLALCPNCHSEVHDRLELARDDD